MSWAAYCAALMRQIDNLNAAYANREADIREMTRQRDEAKAEADAKTRLLDVADSELAERAARISNLTEVLEEMAKGPHGLICFAGNETVRVSDRACNACKAAKALAAKA